MLIDSNILIDFLKGNEKAKSYIAKETELATSMIVVMELIAGLKKKRDITLLEKFLKRAQIQVIPLNHDISTTAYSIYKKYFHKNSVGIPDSLIAATTMHLDTPLATLNTKHFRSIKGLRTVKPY